MDDETRRLLATFHHESEQKKKRCSLLRYIPASFLLIAGTVVAFFNGQQGRQQVLEEGSMLAKTPQRKVLPHVVMIVIDDAGFNDLDETSSDLAGLSPTFTSIGRRGVRLNQYYGEPVCTVARASILTGLFAHRTGLVPPTSTFNFDSVQVKPFSNFSVPLGISLLPEHLKNVALKATNGIETFRAVAIGKWNIGHCNEAYLPTARGFDSFLGYFNGDISYLSWNPDNYGYYDGSKIVPLRDMVSIENGVLRTLPPNGLTTDEVFTNSAVAALNDSKTSWTSHAAFIYLALHLVHDAFEFAVPNRLLNAASDKDINYRQLIATIEARVRDGAITDRRIKMAQAIVTTDAAIRRVDTALRLLSEQSSRDYIEIIISDNGGDACAVDIVGSSFPLRGIKSTSYEGGIRVRGIIASSLFPRTTSSRPNLYHGIFHHVDWIATLSTAITWSSSSLQNDKDTHLDSEDHWATLYRMKTLNHYDRRSIPPKLYHNRTIYTSLTAQSFTLRKGDWKLYVKTPNVNWYSLETMFNDSAACLTQFHDVLDYRLFHLVSDPNEERDIATNNIELVAGLISAAQRAYFSQLYIPNYPYGEEITDKGAQKVNTSMIISDRFHINTVFDVGDGFVRPWGCAVNTLS